MSIDVPEELAPLGPVDATPPRRPGSLRRTTTIDMTWADGLGTTLTLSGRGRDLQTDLGGDAEVLAEQRVEVLVSPERRVESLVITDVGSGAVEEVPQLVGVSAMGGFRTALGEVAPGVVEAHAPSSLLVDDTPGATLISGFAFSRWKELPLLLEAARAKGQVRRMEGICTGFMPGSSGLAPDGTSRWNHRTRAVRQLAEDADPLAWHEVPEITETAMRRMRRIDVWLEGDVIRIDAMFQDSSTTPDGGREAVHEYTLEAEASVRTLELTRVEPVARVLPYAECPLAVRQVDQLLGVHLRDLRAVVLDRLKGTAGCTHLNDALRALADVPHLVELLQQN
ncbi:DUF2889 domain-containing protein [Nocardioides sp. BP30]|uniref:DUF2889 domain-containing protein n=1 Tax=Nocardioides sp. BP30 TaxID=3036374 RepID=UPI0024688E5F|nr:DUF2889 domain-containing protein [Nocardioides sp. BP30]WGL53989.1 DUF2889 domain-containing protein [Nocardioides sp. BP30]